TTAGLFCANTDDTQRVLWQRQMRILRELSKKIMHLTTRKTIYSNTFEVFEENPKDFPFVALYEVSDDGQLLTLQQKVPNDLPMPLAAPQIDLQADSEKYPEYLKALQTGEAVMVDEVTSRFGPAPARFWDMPPHCMLVLPIVQTNQHYPVALLCIGLNPYREPDSSYTSFFNLVGDQIASALTNVRQLKDAKTKSHYDNQLKNLFLQAPIAISVLRGPNFVIDTANEKMIDLWGKTKEQLMGKPIFEAMPDAQGQGIEELLQRVYRTGETFVTNERTIELVRKGKTERFFVKFIYKALRDENNVITGIMALADDITDQVESRQKIEDSETRNKLAIEAAEIGTFELNLISDEFIYTARFANIFGYDNRLNLKQADFSQLLYHEDVPIREDAFRVAMRTGILFYEARFIKPDNTIVWLRVNG